MIVKMLKNLMASFQGKAANCSSCGYSNPNVAKFCGRCGSRLNIHHSPVRLRNPLFLTALSGFFITFFSTFAFLYLNSPVGADQNLFSDVPVDHQIYSECHNLIALGGINRRNRTELDPYSPIKVDEFNRALLSVLRSKGALSHAQFLPTGTKLTSAEFARVIKAIAIVVGRQNRLEEIEKRAFDDLTRFNVYCVIENLLQAGNR